ncbi:uncharacterized protein LOC105740828 [Nomascus leucogenys]|uniref:uncharacterized protein LOC105740828 n=1 Tax=Nomascus leucogenys TaxID=61853 RepID=UPI00020AF31B|nr:uncharacterized protein LOC105740828 [Nomascus leucogenys]
MPVKGASSLLFLPLPPSAWQLCLLSKRRVHPIRTPLPSFHSWIKALVISNQKVPERERPEGTGVLSDGCLGQNQEGEPLLSPPALARFPLHARYCGSSWAWPGSAGEAVRMVSGALFLCFLPGLPCSSPVAALSARRQRQEHEGGSQGCGVRSPTPCGGKPSSAASSTLWLCPA